MECFGGGTSHVRLYDVERGSMWANHKIVPHYYARAEIEPVRANHKQAKINFSEFPILNVKCGTHCPKS